MDYDGGDESEQLSLVTRKSCTNVDEGETFSATYGIELACDASGFPGVENTPALLDYANISGDADCSSGYDYSGNSYAKEEGSQPFDIELRDRLYGYNHTQRLDVYCQEETYAAPAFGPSALSGLVLLLLVTGAVLAARARLSASGGAASAGRT